MDTSKTTGLQVPFNPKRRFAGPSADDRSIALLKHKAHTAEVEVARLKERLEGRLH